MIQAEANASLWSSVAEGDAEGTLKALRDGADANQESRGSTCPLHFAAARNSVRIVTSLLEYGAKCNTSDNEGFTPLMIASLNGCTEVVKKLLKAGADPTLFRPEEHGGDTALHMATNTDSPEVLEALLSSGVEPNVLEKGPEAKTPLHCAAALCMENLAEILIKHPGCDAAKSDASGRTPARLIRESNPQFSLYLDLCAGTAEHLDKLLISSVWKNEVRKVEKLLGEGANLNVRGFEDQGTLLHLAVYDPSNPVIELLLSRGTSPNAQDSNGFTALMIAARRGATDAMLHLLAHRADPSQTARDGSTALHLAMASDSSSAVTILLNAGVDVNAQKSDGTTPLHEAAKSSSCSIVHQLLDNWYCNVHLTDVTGRMANQVARECGNIEIAGLLDLYLGIGDEDVVDSGTSPNQYLASPQEFHVVAGQPVPPGPSVYRNLSEPYRGVVLIINYREFGYESPPRLGSEKDVFNLESVFTKMGYKVFVHQDLSLSETLEVLDNFKTDEQLKTVDSMFVCITSHGLDRDTFITSDKEKIDVNAVRNKFKDSECPLMKGKPKVFLFNFCRGNTREDTKERTEGLAYNPKDVYGRGDEPSEPPRDMLTLHATTAGFKALRLPDNGTFFVLCLCRSLAAHAHNTDMISIAQKLDQLMKDRYHSTTPELQSFGFQKKFFLNPRAFT